MKVELSQSHDEKGGEIQGLTVEMIQLHTTGLEVKILQCHMCHDVEGGENPGFMGAMTWLHIGALKVDEVQNCIMKREETF